MCTRHSSFLTRERGTERGDMVRGNRRNEEGRERKGRTLLPLRAQRRRGREGEKIFSPLLAHGCTGEKRAEKEVEALMHMRE